MTGLTWAGLNEEDMMDIFTRLGEIDNRVIYTLLILVLLAPLVRPIGLPVSIGQHTRKKT